MRAWIAAAIMVIATSAQAEVSQCPAVADAWALARCALSTSEVVKQARAELAAVLGRRPTAGRYFQENPTVEVSMGRRSASGYGEIDYEAQLGQTFQIGGQREARLAVSDGEKEAASATLAFVEQSVVITVLANVIDVQRARALLRQATDEREIAERLVVIATGRARDGVGSGLDADLAESTRVSAHRAEQSAVAALLSAAANLALTVGADVKLGEMAAELTVPEPSEDLGDLEEQAILHRGDLRSAAAIVRAGEARLKLLSRARIPDLRVGAFVKHEESDVGGVVLGLPLPLFRLNQGEVAEQRARVFQAETNRAQTELKVRLEVRAAKALWAQSKALAALVPLDLGSRLAADAQSLRDAYAAGTMSLATILASLREIFAAARGLVEVRLDLELATLQVYRTVGRQIPLGQGGER